MQTMMACLSRASRCSWRDQRQMGRLLRRAGRLEIEVPTNFAHDVFVDGTPLQRETRGQRVVADDADDAREAVRVLVDERHGLAREDGRRVAARGAEARRNVGCRVGQFERLQLAAEREPLPDLPLARLVQPDGELGLAREYER